MSLGTWWRQLVCGHHWHASIDEHSPIIGYDLDNRIAIRGVEKWWCCWCAKIRGAKRGWIMPPAGRGCMYPPDVEPDATKEVPVGNKRREYEVKLGPQREDS